MNNMPNVFFYAIFLVAGFGYSADGNLPPPSPVDDQVLQQNWDALRERGLRLLPVPKQIRFEKVPVPLTGDGAREVVIVLAKETERGRIAANEIISRVHDFASNLTLVVMQEPKQDAYNIVIENEWPNTFTRDTKRHPEAQKTDQAYGLYPYKDGIVLAGQGEIGMLYAAVTLRWLIEAKDGKVVLYPASVIDWPDYKHRQMGTLYAPYHNKSRTSPEKHLANMRKYIDWLFRMKATMVFRHTIGSIAKRESSKPNTISSSEQLRACALAVNTYAAKRGIRTMQGGGVHLGAYPWDKDRPGFDKMLLFRGLYYSWGRHDLHRIKAINMAEFCRLSGVTIRFIHAVDSGGLLDPEKWSLRDSLTRKMYGNNRAQADIDMFNIYSKELAKVGVDAVLVAYPYTANYLNQDYVMEKLSMPDTPVSRARASELIGNMQKWMRAVNKGIAPGVRMCIREAPRKEMFSFFSCYKDRPMWIYWEVTHWVKGIYPVLSTNLRCIGSGFSPKRPHADILWVNNNDYWWLSEPVIVAGCEYAWNTRFPGSCDYDPAYMESGELVVDDQRALDIIAERAAVGLWGAKAGNILKKFLASHMSWRVAVDPKEMTKRQLGSSVAPLIRKNRKAVVQSCLALDELWKELQRAPSHKQNIMDSFSYPYFVQYRAMAKAAKAFADIHLRTLEITEAILSGNMKAVTERIALARKELAVNQSDYKTTLIELQNEPWVVRYEELSERWKNKLEAKLLKPDFAALAGRLDDLERNKGLLGKKYNIPAWFEKWFTGRQLTAVKAIDAVTIDGALTETSWNNAVPVDQFVGYQQFKMLLMPADLRLLYDDKNIYLGGRLTNPIVGGIKATKCDVNKYTFTEQVEFLFVPGEPGKEALYQFVVDTAGNVFTMRKQQILQGKEPTSIGWKSGAHAAVQKTNRGWSFELAIPLASISRKPQGKWHVALVRDIITSLKPRRVEMYGSVFFNGESCLTANLFSPLIFSNKPPLHNAREPGLQIVEPKMKIRTTQHGSGSEITFGLKIETRHPLVDVSVNVEILDRTNKRLGQIKVMNKDYLILKYATAQPFRIQLDTEHTGVKLKATMIFQSLDGLKHRKEKLILLGKVSAAVADTEIFCEGVTPGSKGLSVPIHFCAVDKGTRLFSCERGTIEFWISPSQDMAQPPERWGERFLYLFHCGPMHKGTHTTPGRDSIAIIHDKAGYLSLWIVAPDNDRRLVYARLPDWKAGQWHHVACVWDINDNGKSELAIYLDGKKSTKCIYGRSGRKEDTRPLSMHEISSLIQVGSLNSGGRMASAAFDEIRIWTKPHYVDDFTPARTIEDQDGLLRFSFEDGLTGHFRMGDKKGSIVAIVGAQRD